MEKDLLEIIDNYGVLHQLEYYQSEVWELNEAIIKKENTIYFGRAEDYINDIDHIAEELADNFVMLYQFKEYYKLDFELLKDIITFDSNPLRYLKIFFKDVHRLSKKIIEIETLGGNIIHIEKFELTGCLMLVLYELKQFQAYYGITDEEIEDVMKFKVERQKERMKNEIN